MKFWAVLAFLTISVSIATPAAAQCNEFENLLGVHDVFFAESERDKFGNFYIVGNFRNPNFVIGTTQIVLHGSMSYFLVKLDKDFNLIWATSGGKYAFGNSLELDHEGNVVISGVFYEQISFDCYQLSSKGDSDVFVAKYDSYGHALWALSSEGQDRENETDLSIGPQNNILLSGSYGSSGTMHFGDVEFPYSIGYDGFLVCISPSGDALWGTAIGTSTTDNFPDYIYDTTVDSDGNVIITGMFESMNVRIGSFTLNKTAATENYFLAKFNAAGEVIWVRDTPGPDDSGKGVITDSHNNIFVTGRFAPGTYSIGGIPLSSNGDADVFVAKYSPGGNIIDATSFGGARWEQPQGLCVLPNDNIAIAAQFYSYDLSIGSFNLTKSEFQADMFTVLLDNDLEPLCVKRSSGAGDEWVFSLEADMAGNLMMCINGAPLQFDNKFTYNESPGYAFVMIGDEQNFENTTSTTPYDFSLGNDVVKCLNESHELKAPALCNATYLWSNGSVSPAISVINPGQYWVNVTLNGVTARDTIVVSIQEGPTFDLGNDVAICEGDFVAFNVTQSTPAQYLWDDGSTLPTRTVGEVGTYWVKVTGQCGELTDDIKVVVPQNVVFDFGADRRLCNGETLTLSSGIIGAVEYLWQDGSTASEFEVEDTGQYILTISSACKSHTDTINVERLQVGSLKIPNVVTANPEHDNDNNTFILPDDLRGSKVSIFNRYGALVFSSSDYRNTWPEIKAASGVYYYQLHGICDGHTLKGSIHLLH